MLILPGQDTCPHLSTALSSSALSPSPSQVHYLCSHATNLFCGRLEGICQCGRHSEQGSEENLSQSWLRVLPRTPGQVFMGLLALVTSPTQV